MTYEFLEKATLLYVEDEELIRTFMEGKLKRKVKNLHVAKDGQEGFEKYCEIKPDIILTDITMPKLNGIDMSAKIKEIDSSIPIVIMSAHSDTSFLLKAIELGINGYILKPLDKTKLFDTLERNVKTIFLEKELEEKKSQLLHQSRFALLGEMISMIAHQWRQPLNIISMSLVNLKMKFESNQLDLESQRVRELLPQKVGEYLDKANNHIQNLSNVIDNFADFYRTSTEINTTNINSILEKAIQTINQSLDNEQISIQKEYLCTKDSTLYENDFYQICLNLLNNSQEMFKEKNISNPQICICTKDLDDGVELSIRDNAGGISQDIIDKIFDPYFSTKTEKNGKGLGLYMSKLIIEEHLHGNISVRNEEDGVTFIIQLKD